MPAIITFMAAVALLAAILLFGPEALQSLSVLLQFSPAWQVTLFTLALFGPILGVGWAGARWANVASSPAVSLPAAFLRGLGLGFAGLSIAVAYAFIAGSAGLGAGEDADGGGRQIALLAWGCAVVLFQAGAEEYYFRGWLQPVLAQRWGQGLAVMATAIAFAALHFIAGATSPWSLINLLLGGVLFGLLAARGGGIGAATGAHFAWNGGEQLLFGLDPNPGVGVFGAVVDLDLGGTPLWGGSPEGLNASLPMTLALVVVLIPLLILFRSPRAGVALAA